MARTNLMVRFIGTIKLYWSFVSVEMVPLKHVSYLIPVPPEERFATQLQQLQEMGFYDRAENIRALLATNGNVNAAVEQLLGSIGQ